MQQVENRIFGLLVGFVFISVRRIDIHATFETQGRGVIPDHVEVAMLRGTGVVFRQFAGDEQDAEEAGAVTLDQRVGKIRDIYPVNVEIVGPEFRCRCVDGAGPDAILAAGHRDYADLRVLYEGTIAVVIGIHPGSVQADIDCLRGCDAECGLVPVDDGGNNPCRRGNDGETRRAALSLPESRGHKNGYSEE